MKKLRLELESVTVESFATTERGRSRAGTVRGHDWTEWCHEHTRLPCGGTEVPTDPCNGCIYEPVEPTEEDTCAFPSLDPFVNNTCDCPD
jgi:hypothetical protein